MGAGHGSGTRLRHGLADTMTAGMGAAARMHAMARRWAADTGSHTAWPRRAVALWTRTLESDLPLDGEDVALIAVCVAHRGETLVRELLTAALMPGAHATADVCALLDMARHGAATPRRRRACNLAHAVVRACGEPAHRRAACPLSMTLDLACGRPGDACQTARRLLAVDESHAWAHAVLDMTGPWEGPPRSRGPRPTDGHASMVASSHRTV